MKEQILRNNYEQMELLTNDQSYQTISYPTPQEARNGLFNAHLSQNTKTYAITYLNGLIHGLLRAAKSADSEINLVSFSSSDLLRSKCSSSEDKITGLYNYINLFSTYRPEIFRVVKIKDRLDSFNKDVLINVVYRETIVIEIQLNINKESRFLQSCDLLNHMIYALQRAKFGPMAELSDMWMRTDLRAPFYEQRIKQRHQDIPKEKCSHQFKRAEMELNLPYKCDHCLQFIRAAHPKRYLKCNECRKVYCPQCVCEGVEDWETLKSLLPEINSVGKEFRDCHLIHQKEAPIPEVGWLVDIRFQNYKPVKYQLSSKGSVQRLFTVDASKKIQLIKELSKKESYGEFFRNHVMLEPMMKEDEFIPDRRISREYDLVAHLAKAQRQQHPSIMLDDRGIDDEFFTRQKQAI